MSWIDRLPAIDEGEWYITIKENGSEEILDWTSRRRIPPHEFALLSFDEGALRKFGPCIVMGKNRTSSGIYVSLGSSGPVDEASRGSDRIYGSVNKGKIVPVGEISQYIRLEPRPE